MFTNLLTQSLSFLVPKIHPIRYQLLSAFVIAIALLFIKIWMPDVGRNSPFLLFMTAVILTSWFGGFIAGITLSILSAVLVSFILITPFGILNDHPIISVEAGLFVAECFFISIFVEFVKKTLEEVSLD